MTTQQERKQPEKGYTWAEQMVVVLARELRDDDVVIVGGARHDIPCGAAMLAKRLYVPDMTLLTTGQFVNPVLPPLEYSGHTTVLFSKEADALFGGYEVFEVSERGLSVFFYGGLQIDKYGNSNMHFIGDPKNPTVRGPGIVNVSFSTTAGRTYLFPVWHNKRTFVDKVDFISAVGHLQGGNSRKKAGIETKGPVLCASPLGVFDFEPKTKHMQVKSVHEWVARKEIVENTGFELIWPEKVGKTKPPTKDELTLLHKEIDPHGIFRGLSGRL
ncbi:MAG: CoA synthetase [Chloroflexi bacterium]|nr:CoA synthetase [Chloroflexota bacterium]